MIRKQKKNYTNNDKGCELEICDLKVKQCHHITLMSISAGATAMISDLLYTQEVISSYPGHQSSTCRQADNTLLLPLQLSILGNCSNGSAYCTICVVLQ